MTVDSTDRPRRPKRESADHFTPEIADFLSDTAETPFHQCDRDGIIIHHTIE